MTKLKTELAFGNPEATHNEARAIAFSDVFVEGHKWNLTLREGMTQRQFDALFEMMIYASKKIVGHQNEVKQRLAALRQEQKQAAQDTNRTDPTKPKIKAKPTLTPAKVEIILRTNSELDHQKHFAARNFMLDEVADDEEAAGKVLLLETALQTRLDPETGRKALKYLFGVPEIPALTAAQFEALFNRYMPQGEWWTDGEQELRAMAEAEDD
jgi:hypothetical protein